LDCYAVVDDEGYYLVFKHDSSTGKFWSKSNNNAEVKHFGTSPADAKYSRLDELETYGRVNGAFQFKLEYPRVGITNIWSQTSNPVTATSRVSKDMSQFLLKPTHIIGEAWNIITASLIS